MQDQHHGEVVQRMTAMLLTAAVLLGVLVPAGCSNTEDTVTRSMTVNKSADIAQTSADAYNNNSNGLITGTTLQLWLDDWPANRPTGITGKLVILQTGIAPDNGQGYTDREYLKHDDTNVFTYNIQQAAWVQQRSNGVSKTTDRVPDGAQVDEFFSDYTIDPAHDMIVIAMGRGGAVQAGIVGRGWIMFRYWGVAKKNLAILDGDIANAIDDDAYFTSNPSGSPSQGTVSVRNLRVDNSALQASLETMLGLTQGKYIPTQGAFIWDARSADEYNGLANQTGLGLSSYVAFEGHIRGASHLAFSNLLDATDYTAASWGPSYRYLDKATIKSQLATAGYQSGNTVFTYSKAGYGAMVAGIASGVILGYPTRLYDGGWIEWGQLAWAVNVDGSHNLVHDSPWRTDQAFASTPINYNASANVSALPPANLVDEYATSANLAIEEDKAYMRGGDGDDTVQDLPQSPCG